MRSFSEILTESTKTYDFKIGVAGELPDGFADRMKTALSKYNVSALSAGKRTPIQDRPLDFPQLENTEVTYYDVSLHYPTTVQVLQEYLGTFCSVDKSHIIVRGANEMQELYQQEHTETPYEIMLTKEELGGESAQESVGNSRVMGLLKDLELARKERNSDPIGSVKAGESTKMDATENNKSIIGN